MAYTLSVSFFLLLFVSCSFSLSWFRGPSAASAFNTRAKDAVCMDERLQKAVDKYNRGALAAPEIAQMVGERVRVLESDVAKSLCATVNRSVLDGAKRQQLQSAIDGVFQRQVTARVGHVPEEIFQQYNVIHTLPDISSGRSALLEIIPRMGKPETRKLKLMRDATRFQREQLNYNRICGGERRRGIVHIHGFYKQQRGPNAIALEAGESNLFLLLQRGGPLRGAELRTIAGDMLHALRQIHESGLVWTDCKLQNFICVRDRSTLRAKAIDFESCVENGESLADLSPVSSPPELARALLARENPPPSATSEGDVWALGLSLLALSTNVLPAPMRLGLSPAQVFEATLSMYDGAASGEDRVESYLRAVNNPMLRRLLSKMLALEPKQRLSASQALASPYFWSIF